MIEDLIIDVGLHTGEDTAFYLAKGFRVLAIEANPLLVEQSKQKFANYLAAGRLMLLNVGVGDREEIAPFYVNRAMSEWSSFEKKVGTTRGAYDVIGVPVVSLRSVLE